MFMQFEKHDSSTAKSEQLELVRKYIDTDPSGKKIGTAIQEIQNKIEDACNKRLVGDSKSNKHDVIKNNKDEVDAINFNEKNNSNKNNYNRSISASHTSRMNYIGKNKEVVSSSSNEPNNMAKQSKNLFDDLLNSPNSNYSNIKDLLTSNEFRHITRFCNIDNIPTIYKEPTEQTYSNSYDSMFTSPLQVLKYHENNKKNQNNIRTENREVNNDNNLIELNNNKLSTSMKKRFVKSFNNFLCCANV